MSDAEDIKFSLKVMINKQKTKVLYAEAGSDFTDVLLSFLTLPLGTIVRIFGKHYGDEAPFVGSLTTLYNGLSNLDSDYFSTESGRQMLLNPRKSLINERCKLKLNVDDTPLTKAFLCADKNLCSLKKSPNMGLYYGTAKCDCGKSVLSKEEHINDPKTLDAGDGDCGVYTKSKAAFVITDDLQIFPSETGYALQIFRSLGITGTDGTQLRNVSFGFNEVMNLLRGSLLSPTPLTNLILSKGKLENVNMKCENGTGNLLGDQIEKNTFEGRKMVVKVIFRESTNKLLLAEADCDSVEFLFSLLTVPLGEVEHLLCNSTTLRNIDNLYRTLASINGDKYLKKDIKTMLLEPELPQGYISKSKILPLVEESYLYTCGGVLISSIKSPKGDGNYVKGPKMYMITDDLTVTPLCTASSISIIDQLKVPLSDVKEMELEIGLKEALSILKASLTSTSALTNGLINPTFFCRPFCATVHQ